MDIFRRMDGVAAYNRAEPSPGDLERISKAYAEERRLRQSYEDAVLRNHERAVAMEQDRDKYKKMLEVMSAAHHRASDAEVALTERNLELREKIKGLESLLEVSREMVAKRDAEVKRLGDEVEELMKVDYWQDRHNIIKQELITAIQYLREAKTKFAPGTTNSFVDSFLQKHEGLK